MTSPLRLAIVLAALLAGAGCSAAAESVSGPDERVAVSQTPSTTAEVVASTSTAPPTTGPTTTSLSPPTTASRPSGSPPPEWLGTRPLPLRDGEDNAVAQPTPDELVDRRLWTVDTLPPPAGDRFESVITSPPPADVVARSTWRPDCPVGLDELAYLQVSFFGFDGVFHTGELIVRTEFADAVVDIFDALHAMRFPIEEMRVTTQADVDAHPTGDSNNTSSFVCRPAVNSGAWSRHAHAGAIDINPFHNPYVKGDLVIPELASAYLDRDRDVPGMITPEIEALFEPLGWGWGGQWRSASDWMHFSDTGN